MTLPVASISPEPAVSQWQWPQVVVLVDNREWRVDEKLVAGFSESFRRFLFSPEAEQVQGADDDGADF